MKRAALVLILGVLVFAGSAAATIPDGMVAIIYATSVEGIANHNGPVKVERSTAVSYDGNNYAFPDWVVSALPENKAILVINHRRDYINEGVLVKKHTQEVQIFDDSMFEVQVNANTAVSYQVASVAGNLRIFGDEGHIACQGGTSGPYQIWRIDDIDLVAINAIKTLTLSN